MTTATTSPDTTTIPRQHPRNPQVPDIIERARANQQRQRGPSRFLVTAVLSCATALMLWASFKPLDFSPLAWIALVPLLVTVRLGSNAARFSAGVYLGALAYHLPTLQWMRLGDPTMYVAWVALAVYLAVYWPVFVFLSRTAVHRWSIPMWVATPVVWTGLDFVRAHLMTGFSWYYLGHTQYRWLELIQISDVFGAYGVTFVIVMANAVLASLIPETWLRRLPGLGRARQEIPRTTPLFRPVTHWTSLLVLGGVLGAVLGYGAIRRGQAEFLPGPRVALIQGNFVASLRRPPEEYATVYTTHRKLTGLAVREQPDLIVWPESMFPWPLMQAPDDLSEGDLKRIAPQVPPQLWRDTEARNALTTETQMAGAAMIIGLEAIEPGEKGIRQHNSALFLRPDVGLAGRYDKIHLVPFGEYLPFSKTLPWLRNFTPYPPDWGLTPGKQAAVFEYQKWRMAPVICFEDTVPHLVRSIVSVGSQGEQGKQVDLLVNLSNDGWFHGSSELDQHLITAAFRAVECRLPVVRAVNTGISAVIDGDGAIREPEVFLDGDRRQPTASRDPKTGRWKKSLNAAVIQTVPLDARTSLYVRFGDWFAILCTTATLLVGMSVCLPRKTSVPPPPPEEA